MKRWHFSLALLAAGWLVQAENAWAQYIPTPLGAARIPEPMPCAAPMPDLVPGPISPQAAPPVPPCGTDFPAGHSSAFQCEEFVLDQHCYANIGTVGLMRQKLGNQPIALLDPNNLKNDIVTPGNLPIIQDFGDLGQRFEFGPKATLGYLWGSQAIEVTGFWIPEFQRSVNDVQPGRLNQLFFNPPPGFEGDNGLFIHDDRVNTEFHSTMWNAEANYRYSNAGIMETELILGVRYLDVWEMLVNYTGDDDVTAPLANGNPDPLRQAFYQVQAHNHIIAPQIGFECSYPATPCFTFGLTGKAAAGVDIADIQTKLTRGDGYIGFETHRQTVIGPSQIYDMGAFLDVNVMEKLHIRLGYNALFLVNVATAVDEFNYNLATPTAGKDHGTIFYHGPTAELQFLF